MSNIAHYIKNGCRGWEGYWICGDCELGFTPLDNKNYPYEKDPDRQNDQGRQNDPSRQIHSSRQRNQDRQNIIYKSSPICDRCLEFHENMDESDTDEDIFLPDEDYENGLIENTYKKKF